MIDSKLEKNREYKRRYKRNNREKIRRADFKYRKENKKKIKKCNKRYAENNKKKLEECSIEYRRKYKEKISEQRKEYRKKNVDKIKLFIRKKKLKVFGYKKNIGCQVCGYNKCSSALDFHHRSSEKKIIDVSRLTTSKWEDFLSEAKKCIVVCRNCHAEIHYNLRNNIV